MDSRALKKYLRLKRLSIETENKKVRRMNIIHPTDFLYFL